MQRGSFHNKTNGITPRRWLVHANPGLSKLITERIGSAWIEDLERLRELEAHVDDEGFLKAFADVKRANKERLAHVVEARTGVSIDPAALLDVQVKRIHEYKRQLLAALHVAHLYLEIVEDGRVPEAPRTCLFAGKAAPSYVMAKLVIRLICSIAKTIDDDPRAKDHLRVVFFPDYGVSVAERIIPAADLSEQISTAGREASGTGNMKLALNGALTIGTLDGANIEIRERVGEDNIYIFGLRAEEIEELGRSGSYDPAAVAAANPALRRVLDAIRDGRFAPDEPDLFHPIHAALVEHGDHYYHLGDFASYAETQQRVAHDYLDEAAWARRAALNVARIGYFSSDRVVREYADETWKLARVP